MNKKLLINSYGLDAVSDKHIEDTKNILNENLDIIKIDNGVNTDRFKILEKQNVREKMSMNEWKHVIGYAGNYPLKRGASQIISIADKLIKEFNDIGFIVLGEDEDPLILTELIKKNGLENTLSHLEEYHMRMFLMINTFDIGVSFGTKTHGRKKLAIY